MSRLIPKSLIKTKITNAPIERCKIKILPSHCLSLSANPLFHVHYGVDGHFQISFYALAWVLEAKGQGIKRESSALYPLGGKSGAVLATVSGRGVINATGETWEGRHINPMTVSQNIRQAL